MEYCNFNKRWFPKGDCIDVEDHWYDSYDGYNDSKSTSYHKSYAMQFAIWCDLEKVYCWRDDVFYSLEHDLFVSLSYYDSHGGFGNVLHDMKQSAINPDYDVVKGCV